MAMKRLQAIIILMHLGYSFALSQRVVTIGECYRGAYTVTALNAEKGIYERMAQLKEGNATKNWFPTVDINGNFAYHSEVVDLNELMGKLPLPLPPEGIKSLPHEQYRVTFDVTQTIYDGGAVRSARLLEQATGRVNQAQTEVDLYDLRSRINGYYFNLLLLSRQREVLNSHLEVVRKRILSAESAVGSGVALKSDVDALEAERIKLQQQLTENAIGMDAMRRILSGYTGIEFDSSTSTAIPVVDWPPDEEISRPELQLLDIRSEQLEASKLLLKSGRMPKAYGFATLGYGNPPGSNFFKTEAEPFYVVGAGVKWNIFDWNRARNERQVISYQQDLLNVRKNDIIDNLRHLLDAKRAEIESLEALVKSDEELLQLRKRIREAAEAKYENGVMTATEYLNELNAERQALLSQQIHMVNLGKAKVEYMNICGKDISE